MVTLADALSYSALGWSVIPMKMATKRPAVRVALEEVDLRHGREAPDLVHRERQRPLDHAVHQQPMLGRIDIRNAIDVIHQEVQAGRRDDSVQILQRRRQRRIRDGSRRPE